MKLSESLKLWTSYTPTLWLLRPSPGGEEVKTQRLLVVYLKETYRIIDVKLTVRTAAMGIAAFMKTESRKETDRKT